MIRPDWEQNIDYLVKPKALREKYKKSKKRRIKK